MSTRKAVADRILSLCAQQGVAPNALARSSAVPPSALKNIASGVSKSPGIVTIKKLCDGLNISLPEFFDSDEFRSLEQEIKWPRRGCVILSAAKDRILASRDKGPSSLPLHRMTLCFSYSPGRRFSIADVRRGAI